MENKNNDFMQTILVLLGTVALIVLAIGLKAFAVRWLWNELLIDWAELALPIMDWTKALCTGIALTLSTSPTFKGNSK